MRSDVREGVQIYIMSDIKPNFTHLARQFECDPRTVKRYYENALPKKKAAPKKRPSKLDPFRSIIQEKVELGCSASAIYRFIKKKGLERRPCPLQSFGPTISNQFIFICSRLFSLEVYRVNARQKTRYITSLFEQCLSLFRRNPA